jgi:multidrug efflux pump subunit AcrA (membrane-fusion protein)
VNCRMAILACIAGTVLSCGPSRDRTAEKPAPIPVEVGKVHRLRTAETISVSGSVATPDNPSNAAFLVAGKVISVGPREGDHAGRGRVLAVIDPTDYKMAVAAAVAQAAAARAVLEKAESPVRPELLEQARVAFERSQDEYRRMKMLYDSKSLAPNDFQKFEAAYRASRQQFEQARAGGQKEDRAQARAVLEQAVAAEDIARKRLADATLRSPIDGFVSSRTVELGDVAAPGRPVFQIVRLDPVEIVVGIPETDIHSVRAGQKASLRVPALPGETFTGTVRVVNVAADPSTRSYMVRIQVPNPKHALRVGMIAEAQIQTDRTMDAMTLPGEAIAHDPQGATVAFVYFPDQKRVYAKRVDTGTVFGREIQIRAGLTGNESIVLGGQDKLRDGIAVTAVEAPPEPRTNRPEGK